MINKFKLVLPYLIVLLLSCLGLILLDEDYIIGMYTLIITVGISPFFIGISNSLHYLRQGFGRTRKKAMNDYLISLVKCVILGFIYLIIITLFSILVYRRLYITYTKMIFTCLTVYLFSLLFSGFGMLIGNMYRRPYIISVLLVITALITLLFGYLFIKELYIVCIVVSFILCISIFIINKLTFKFSKF